MSVRHTTGQRTMGLEGSDETWRLATLAMHDYSSTGEDWKMNLTNILLAAIVLLLAVIAYQLSSISEGVDGIAGDVFSIDDALEQKGGS